MATMTCPACAGSGNPSVSGERSTGCMTCGGQGWVYETPASPEYDGGGTSAPAWTPRADPSTRSQPPAPRPAERKAAPTRSKAGGASSPSGADGFFALAGFLVGGGYAYSSTDEPIAALIAGLVAGFVAQKTWRIVLGIAIVVVIAAVLGR